MSVYTFDIKSLFSNIPFVGIIELYFKELFNLELATQHLKKTVFEESLKLACVGVKFSFKNQMYKQIDDISVGSPLELIISNRFF